MLSGFATVMPNPENTNSFFLCLILDRAFNKACIIIFAAPVHQLQQYYRVGVLDNCFEKWSAFMDCLMLKTKPASEVQVSFSFILSC